MKKPMAEKSEKPTNLAPLTFDEALRGLLETPPVKAETLSQKSKARTGTKKAGSGDKKKRAPKKT